MISHEIKLISFESIKLFSKKVTHKISQKNLAKFLKTTLVLENIELTQTDKIFFSYIDEIQTYEIYLISTDVKYPAIIPYIFGQYYEDDTKNSIDLFITNKFYTVYKNKQFYFVQPNKGYATEDIKKYIKHHYQINIDNIYDITSNQLENLQIKYLQNIHYKKIIKPISIYDNNKYIYFIVYCLVVFGILGYYIFSLYFPKKTVTKLKSIPISTSVYIKQQNVTTNIIELFNYLKIYKIAIVKFDYNKVLDLVLICKSKSKFYDFVTVYNKKVAIKTIKFEPNLQRYIMEVEIEF